ncbi:hypothetical protein B5F34_07290 [Mediterranea sp. An20]|uniref:O-antigen ligase family protein n=1 Tax=Mediterranea sp. An20 TaxID=1965586 RepID=UPI000B38ACB0|nr:O-antigen ligase family protein [Mediterranea sp. An20]OUP09033.1 hypothetical protein B5F34_07290 [Mediterranea sp. An20]
MNRCNTIIIKRDDVTRFLLNVMLLTNLFFALFPAWKGSIIWNYLPDIEKYFLFTGYGAIMVNFLLSIVLISLNTKIYGRSILVFCYLAMSVFTLSMFQNGFSFKIPEGIMALCVYMVLVGILPKFHFGTKMQNLILFVLLFWSILPILYFSLAPIHIKALFYSIGGTFSGFALHRNFYAVYVGIAFLLLMFVRYKMLYKFILWILLLIGLLLSECRTAILALFIVTFYYKYSDKRSFYFYLVIAIIVGFICYSMLLDLLSEYTMRNDLDNNVTREELYKGFWDFFVESPILGKGEDALYYSSSYPDGSPAHNLVLQIMASYGVFELVFFLVFYILIFRTLDINGKTLFLYLFIISMFQPYIDVGFPTSLMVIILYLCRVFSKTNYVSISQWRIA